MIRHHATINLQSYKQCTGFQRKGGVLLDIQCTRYQTVWIRESCGEGERRCGSSVIGGSMYVSVRIQRSHIPEFYFYVLFLYTTPSRLRDRRRLGQPMGLKYPDDRCLSSVVALHIDWLDTCPSKRFHCFVSLSAVDKQSSKQPQ